MAHYHAATRLGYRTWKTANSSDSSARRNRSKFYLSVPFLPSAGPHFLRIKVTEGQDLLAEAAFDLREGLLFAIDDKLHS